MYNSKEYWNKRPNPNKGSQPEEVDVKFIPPFLKGAQTVLELGPGVGRMFPFYKGLNVTGVDFASQYANDCLKSAEENELKVYKHWVHDIHKTKLPFDKHEFQKGMLIKVLLHAPIREAKTIIKEMAYACKEVLIISYNGKEEGLAAHCFKHDYEEIINSLGFNILEKETFGNQIIIRYEWN